MEINIPRIIKGRKDKEMLNDGRIIEQHLDIFKDASTFFNKNIKVHYMNSDLAEKRNGNTTIQVMMWSAYEDSEMEFPESDIAFGYKFCNDGVYKPSEGCISYGDTIPLIQYDPQQQQIHFLYDVCDNETQDEIKLMEKLIYELLVIIAGNEEEYEKKLKEGFNRIDEIKCNQVIEKLMESEKRRQIEREEQINRDKDKIRSYREKVRQLYAKVEVNEKIVKAGGLSINDFKAKLNEEINIMKKNAKVSRIEMDNGRIIIHTNDIVCKVPDCPDGKVRYYYFGKYKVFVNLTDGDVKFEQKIEKCHRRSCWSDKCPHPHISDYGEACLGSCAPLIADCIDTYQWGILADVLVTYLESVNLQDSAGKNFYRWDECDKDGKLLEFDNDEDKYNPWEE